MSIFKYATVTCSPYMCQHILSNNMKSIWNTFDRISIRKYRSGGSCYLITWEMRPSCIISLQGWARNSKRLTPGTRRVFPQYCPSSSMAGTHRNIWPPRYSHVHIYRSVPLSNGDFFSKITMTSSNGNIFRVTGPLWGESTGDRWIPPTKASDAELWCFPLSAPEQTAEQTIKTRWFETPSYPLWRHCNDPIGRPHGLNMGFSCEWSFDSKLWFLFCRRDV